jgi:hypothetical protein
LDFALLLKAFGECGNSDALAVARNLDKKVEGVLLEAAALAHHS